MPLTSTSGLNRFKVKSRRVGAKSTTQSVPSNQTIQVEVRECTPSTPLLCSLAPSVTTPLYSTTVCQALRQTLRAGCFRTIAPDAELFNSMCYRASSESAARTHLQTVRHARGTGQEVCRLRAQVEREAGRLNPVGYQS